MNFSKTKIFLITTSFVFAFRESSFAVDPKEFYECSGFGGTAEYRVGINLETKRAAFFDNIHTSFLKLKKTSLLKSNPPQTLVIFRGKDVTEGGRIRLEFNLTLKTARLVSIEKKSRIKKLIKKAPEKEIGSASCKIAEVWDELD